jgi:hypothetical protein
MTKQDCNPTVENFITSNLFKKIAYNPTEQYQKPIRCSSNNNKNKTNTTQTIRKRNGHYLHTPIIKLEQLQNFSSITI